MKANKLRLPLILLVSIVGTISLGATTVTQWEYMKFDKDATEGVDLRALNALGALGWELVDCPTDSKAGLGIDEPDEGVMKHLVGFPISTHCILKRKKN